MNLHNLLLAKDQPVFRDVRLGIHGNFGAVEHHGRHRDFHHQPRGGRESIIVIPFVPLDHADVGFGFGVEKRQRVLFLYQQSDSDGRLHHLEEASQQSDVQR